MEQQMNELLQMYKIQRKIIEKHQINMIQFNVEVWKIINGYDNYQISSFGRVRNIISGNVLKPQVGTTGYYQVSLHKNGKSKNNKIHKLVANAFINNLSNKRNIDHMDNERLNNHVSNLRWCTSQENARNTKLSNKSTSGVKGICFHKQQSKWRAHIVINGKQIHLGLFDTLDDAKVARQFKANQLFGNFVHLSEKL